MPGICWIVRDWSAWRICCTLTSGILSKKGSRQNSQKGVALGKSSVLLASFSPTSSYISTSGDFLNSIIAKVCFAQCSTSRLALGSPGCLFGRSVGRHHAQNIFKTLIMLYFWKAQGPRTSKLIFPTVKYTNTQIHIYKYTNTAYDEVPGIPNICYISKQLLVQGCQ